MSANLSQKEVRVLIRHLQQQGLEFVRTTKGYEAADPKSHEFIRIHTSGSDHRGTLNLRGQIKRLGYTWPTDPDFKKKEDWEADVPAYLTMQGPPRGETLRQIEQTIDQLVADGNAGITVKQIADKMGRASNDYTAIYRAMLFLGWIPTEEQRGRLKTWVRAPEPEGIVPGDPVDSEDSPESVEDTIQQLKKSGVTPGERIILDSAESWALHSNLSSIQDVSVRQLRGMMLAAGLHMEIRVWPGAMPKLTPAESADPEPAGKG
jgi:hypothetical protein